MGAGDPPCLTVVRRHPAAAIWRPRSPPRPVVERLFLGQSVIGSCCSWSTRLEGQIHILDFPNFPEPSRNGGAWVGGRRAASGGSRGVAAHRLFTLFRLNADPTLMLLDDASEDLCGYFYSSSKCSSFLSWFL